MQSHLAVVLPVLGLLLLPSCSLLAQQRWQSTRDHIHYVFTQCETQRLHDRAAQWTETVRCGNDGTRSILAHSRSPYADLIAAALASRLAIAQQIDAGMISEGEGTARIAVLDHYIHTLPGSLLDLLTLTASATRQ
jgi:hypothetical protein